MPTTYGIAPVPIWRFLDNLGEKAVNGSITFYKNSDRSTKKAIYQDAGATIEWPNPIELNQAGEVENLIYFADDETYYLEIRDNTGLIIHFIENFPIALGGGGGGGGSTSIDIENFALNGQFRFFQTQSIHNTTDLSFKLAEMWSYERDNTSANPTFSFERFSPGDVAVDEATPIYYLKYDSSAGVGQTKNDLIIKFKDVRSLEQEIIVIQLQARRTQGGGDLEVLFEQNFGSGGSASAAVITAVETLNLDANWDKRATSPFTVPSIGGKILDGGDDYIAIHIRYPLNTSAEVHLTNFAISIGNKTIEYPRVSYEEEKSKLLGGEIPYPQDGDEGKAVMVSDDLDFVLDDPMPVGMAFAFYGDTLPPGRYEWCDHSTRMVRDRQRLFNVIGHRGGYGQNAFRARANGSLVTVMITHSGAVNNVADVNSGLTFATPNPGTATLLYDDAFTNSAIGNAGALVYFVEAGPIVSGTANVNAGVSLSVLHNPISGAANNHAFINMNFPAGSTITAGNYFNLAAKIGVYSVWYEVDGSGSAPSVGTTPHKASIKSTDDAVAVMFKTMSSLAGYQVSEITCSDANSITDGHYFYLYNSTTTFYVWFDKNGAGNDPQAAGATGVKVSITTGQTAAEVATALATALNNTFFRLPPSNGLFERFLSGNAFSFDPDINARAGGAQVGTLQFDQNRSHNHNYTAAAPPGENADGGTIHPLTAFTTYSTAASGGHESRPMNVYVRKIIKY